jgi:hypothetical protein
MFRAMKAMCWLSEMGIVTEEPLELRNFLDGVRGVADVIIGGFHGN